MKNLLSLILVSIFLVSCSSLTGLRPAKIKGNVNKTASLYIDPAIKNKFVFSSKKNTVGFKLSDGVKSDNNSWSQNIGELSAQQFQDASKKAFANVELVNSNPKKALNSTYLIVPSIVDAKVTIRDLMQSYVTITYKVDVYDKSGSSVYSDELTIEEKGKFKSVSMTSVGGIPISANANLRPDESPMIFEAVSNGVDKLINKMVKSNKL
jgi:uncharacterized protein YcfL